MDFLGLDNKYYPLKVNDQREHQSKLHTEAINLIKKIYPCLIIKEEVSIKINKKITLFLDIIIFSLGIVIEINGEQHDKYVHFFHKNKANFRRSVILDSLKKEWCTVNNFKLVQFNWNETQDEWREKLRQAISR